jgi:hypothetical protein
MTYNKHFRRGTSKVAEFVANPFEIISKICSKQNSKYLKKSFNGVFDFSNFVPWYASF